MGFLNGCPEPVSSNLKHEDRDDAPEAKNNFRNMHNKMKSLPLLSTRGYTLMHA